VIRVPSTDAMMEGKIYIHRLTRGGGMAIGNLMGDLGLDERSRELIVK